MVLLAYLILVWPSFYSYSLYSWLSPLAIPAATAFLADTGMLKPFILASRLEAD